MRITDTVVHVPRPRFFGLIAAVLAILCLTTTARAATETNERGLPFVQVFRPHDYGDEHNQTWSAVQDRRGTLYVGNRDLVLSYDGFAWLPLRINGIFVRGLAIDAHDRIWVGAVNELGYLDDDGRGARVFTSLRNKLPEKERDFGDIFQVFAFTHGVYFVTNDRILWWHDGTFTVEHVGRVFADAIGDELIVHVRGQPLLAWHGSARRIVADFPELRQNNNWVTFAAAQSDGGWILGTLHGGLWRLADGKLAHFPTEADATFRSQTITRGLQLRDGTLALALRPGGLLLLDAHGAVRHFLDRDNGGLPNSALHGLFQDHDGGLWVLLDFGLARISWPEHATVFNEANGLGRGIIHAMVRQGGTLYVGEFDGLFALDPADPKAVPPREAHFKAIPEIRDNVFGLASAGNELLVAGVGGLRVRSADGRIAMPFSNDVCISVLVLRGDSHFALVGTAGGLLMFRRDQSGWHNEGEIAGVDRDEIRNLVETPDGVVWVSSSRHGFYRIYGLPGTRTANDRPSQVEHFASGHGLGPNPITDLPVVVATGSEPLFLVSEQLYRFDAATREFSAIKVGEPGTRVRGVGTGINGAVWLRLEHEPTDGVPRETRIARLSVDGRLDRFPSTLARAAGQSLVFLEEHGAPGDSTLWVGGTESSLLRVDLPAGLFSPAPFQAVIRRVTQPGGAALALGPSAPIDLPYARRGLNLSFATNRLGSEGMRFEIRMDEENTWSEPLSSPSLSFNSISPGRHLIAVRAHDADAQYSEPAEFAFTVLPPWWATWWAWLAYVVIAIVVITTFVRWRLQALQTRAAQLEATVAARTEELREAKTAAEAANHAKSAFLANMSHELRTPLNAILGFAQILRRAPDLSPEHLQRLAVIGRNGDHLLQLINEVLDLSKIEAGKLAVAPRPVALLSLLQGIAETYAARAVEKGLGFDLQIAPDLPVRVEVDDAKLRQVLHNLLGNALKFTAKGKIAFIIERVDPLAGLTPLGLQLSTLNSDLKTPRTNGSDSQSSSAKPTEDGLLPHHASVSGETIRFAVTDTGVGIAADALPRVFEAFYQAGDRKLVVQGTGLGLAISQRIVGLMGGRIEVESNLDGGSRFHFTLSLPVLAAEAVSPAPVRQVSGYLGPRRRLLIVDDEAVNRDVLRALLEPLGFEFEEATDSASCLALFSQQKFDGVLLDLRMGAGPDGYATARRLRALPNSRGVAIIAISASVFEEDRQTAIDAGCDAFVPKPFTEERLFGALADTMKLQWTYANGTTASTAPFTPAVNLPPADLSDLVALAHGGDVDALRERLAAIAAAHPECAATVRHLDDLAANFKLTALRQALHQATAGNQAS